MGNSYLPVEYVIMQGDKSISRFPRNSLYRPPTWRDRAYFKPPAPQRLAYFNIKMSHGVGYCINSRAYKEDGKIIDTLQDEIKPGTTLPNGDRFIAGCNYGCYVMNDSIEAPEGKSLFFSRITTDREIFMIAPDKTAGKKVNAGDYEKFEVVPKDILTDPDKGYQISFFKGIFLKKSFPFSSDARGMHPADFDWAVIGDTVLAPKTTAFAMGPEKK
jgi:hypothetical protein